jgi:hypothetical protein
MSVSDKNYGEVFFCGQGQMGKVLVMETRTIDGMGRDKAQ